MKPFGGQRVRLKPDSVPTKFVFSTEKQQRKGPCDRSESASRQGKRKTNASKSVVGDTGETVFNVDINNNDINNDTERQVENTGSADPVICIDQDQDIDENEKVLNDLRQKTEEVLNLKETSRAREQELNDKIRKLEAIVHEERTARAELELLVKERAFSVEVVRHNDKLFKFYTGFENYQTFSMVLDFLGREAASHLEYRNTERSISDDLTMIKRGPARTLSIENEFFMVMCRLKVGLLEEDIATRFGVSQGHVSRIISTWIKFMYLRFKELDLFPSSEIVHLHKPACFAKKYSATTLIIDATEIYIEKPANPEAQQLTFSSYKNSNTLKALVGIVPKGAISFVSTLYGGSISDKELTDRSGLINKLKHGDAIMADRGFNIQEMLASKGVRVNLPPFMNESGQFEEHELLETRRIASLRIHAERAMERIKNYHILDFIPITLCRGGKIDMIFFVCAMLTNFLPPLVDG